MVQLRFRSKGFPAMRRTAEKRRARAEAMPTRYILETSNRLAVIHQEGGVQTGGRAMQRAIAAKIGPEAKPPSLTTLAAGLRHPRRPIRVTSIMARRVAEDLAAHVMRGKKRGVRKIMREETTVQYGAGGSPTWIASRNWGRFQAARPPLGGPTGRLAASWRNARYRETR